MQSLPALHSLRTMQQAIFSACALIVVIALLVTASLKAQSRRKHALIQRGVVDLSRWEEINEGLSSADLRQVLDAIAAGLAVEACYLRPTDRFENELALTGHFLLDDDTLKDVAEQVDERLNVRWSAEWRTVSEAVFGIAKQLHAQQR